MYEDTGLQALMAVWSFDFDEALTFRLPRDREQQRTASCLITLDALTTAETQKLESLKTHKKWLVRQLFPSPEEATDL